MTNDRLEGVRLAIEDIRSGKMVVVIDDYDRENEGDLVMAAQFATPDSINFMATHGRGLICLSLSSKLIDKLELPMMSSNNQARYSTAFTVSVEAREGVTTGISAHDRAHTIQTCIRDDASRHDVVVPGHVFPLRAESGGVLTRAGHTEAAVDLAVLAGLKEAGVICEILNDDGTMARVPDLEAFAKKHQLRILAIADLIEYRLRHDNTLVYQTASFLVEEQTGVQGLEVKIFKSSISEGEHLAFVKNSSKILNKQSVPAVRVHVENVLSDWLSGLSSISQTWKNTLTVLESHDAAVVLVLRPKNIVDFFSSSDPSTGDLRDYGLGAQILKSLGVTKMKLVSRHPGRNIVGLEGFGLEILETIDLNVQNNSLGKL